MNTVPEQKIPHILILEDDASHRELCIRAFRDDPDRFRVSVAATLKAARSIVEQDPPDLIIADWLLSEGRGIDILPRKDGRVTIPLLIMTSHGDEKIAVEVMKSGAVDYMVKSASLFKGLPHIARRSLGFWENIQERKRAEEEALESHKRLADILSFLPDATFAIDHEGRVIAWNRAIAEMTGVSADEILGKGDYAYSIPFYGERRPILIDLVQEDDAEILKKYNYVKRDGDKITSETYIPTLFGGRGAYLWGTASPLFDSTGTRVGAIEVIRDITKRKEDEELLIRRQIALDALLNAPRDTIALIDRKGKILNINTEGSRRLGGTPEELIGQSAYARLPPELAESRRSYVDRVFITGKLAIFDDERSGTYLHNEIFPVFNPENTTVDYVAVFARDITDQKLAERALLESERNLSRAQEIGHLGSWSWDIAGNRLFWSDEMYRIFGLSRDFVLYYDAIASRIHPDYREQNDQYVRNLLAGGNTGEFEFRIVRPDGAERWISQKIEIARDPQGAALAAFGIVQDITDRKAAEQALFLSEKKYRFLVDNILDSVWQATPDLVFTYVSPAVKHQLGYTPEEVTGTSLFGLMTESSSRYIRDRLNERMEEFSKGRRDLSSLFEVEMVHKDGGIRSLEVSSTAILGPDGTLEGFQGVTRDITERKRVEAALAESEERFRDLFNNMAAGVVIYTPAEDFADFTIHDLNHAVETIEKVKKEEIVGKSVRDVFPGIVEFGLYDVFCRVARTGIPESHPVSMYKDDRITGWRDNYVYRLPSGEIVALYEDVTEKKQAEEDRERLLAAVEEERQKLSSLVSSITDEVWFADTEHHFTLANPRAVEVFGLDPKETIPVEALAGSVTVLNPDGTPRPVEEAPPLRALNGEVIRNLEEMVRTPLHGELRYRLVSAAPVRNTSGTIIGSVSVVRDITELKRAEEELRVSQAHLREAMDLARLVNWEFDALTGIFTFNDRFYTLYGTTADQEGGYRMSAEEYALRFVHPEDRDLVADEVRKAVEATDPAFISQVEHRIVRRDGEIRTIVVRFGIILDENGRTVKTFGANQDITDRKIMEQSLAESEGRYRSLMEHLPDYVIVHRDGILLYVNPSGASRMGYNPETLVGKPILPLIDPAYHDTIKKAIAQRMGGEDLPSYEIKIVTKDGALRTVLVNGVMIQYGGGLASLNVLTDITLLKEAEEIRKAYELRLESAMEIGSLAWWEMDLPDGLVRFDDRKATMLGYSPDRFHHFTDFTALVHPDDLEPVMQAMRDHLSGREARYHGDYRIRAATGDYQWFRDVGGITRRHPDGSPGTVTGIVIDITAAKEAEDAIRATETRFRALIQNSSDLIRILDADGRILYESPSAERILGYPEGSLLGTDPLELVHPDDLERVRNDLKEVYERTNPGIPTEFRIRKADGEYLWVDTIGTNLLDVPGVNGVVVTTRPIQQRKEAEQALRESEERLRLAMEGADVASWDWDLKTNTAVFSDRFYTMMDYLPGEFPKTYEGWTAHIHPDDKERVLPDLMRQIAEKRPLCEIEYRLLTKDGNWLWILGRGKIAEFDENGTPSRMTGVNIDITNRRLMESEIRSLNAVLEQRVKDRTEALQQANAALEEENAQRIEAETKLQASYNEKVTLLKEIHHRVKNNLQIIASLLNLQSRYIHDDATLAAIRESQNRVRAMALVHEKLYKAEDISHTNLGDYVSFLGAGLFQFYDANRRGIRFQLDIEEVKVDINTAIPLGLIINELISNSLKYAFPEGRNGVIAISVKKTDHMLAVTYSDDGIGIPAGLDWKNTQSLGLRLVNTLVDQLDGTIGLDRSSGTRFTMEVHDKEGT